jgi:hypothetical protein
MDERLVIVSATRLAALIDAVDFVLPVLPHQEGDILRGAAAAVRVESMIDCLLEPA